MRERPILFSGPMVRAILAGEKTQTRRVAKFVPIDGFNLAFSGLSVGHYCTGVPDSGVVLYSRGVGGVWNQRTKPIRCPFGVPGDRLWVRETWMEADEAAHSAYYRADGELDGPWRPSIHMPRWASRITLEITDVRVQRLHAITEEDSEAEGMRSIAPCPCPSTSHSMRAVFKHLWDKLNGTRFPWASNPWVWVIEFRRIKP